MKKYLALMLALAMTLGLTACGSGGSGNSGSTDGAASNGGGSASSSAGAETAADGPKMTLKLGVSTNDTDPRTLAAQEFKAEVEEKTGGSITVEIYTSGQLGGDAQLIEALALDSGTVDIIITDASNFATYEPTMGVSALPFQFKDFEMAWAFMDSEIEAAAEEKLISQNMRVLSHYDNGFRCVTTGSKEVNTPADMNAMLIRTPENPVIMATMQAMGANPQPLAFSELYQALNQGTYDAQENPVPVIYNNNLFEVQAYLSVTNHIYSGMCFTVSESSWQKMNDAQREVVDAAAKSSAEVNRAMNKQQTEELLSKLEEEGMTVIQPDLAPFQEATASVAESYRSTYGTMLDDLSAWLSSYAG